MRTPYLIIYPDNILQLTEITLVNCLIQVKKVYFHKYFIKNELLYLVILEMKIMQYCI